MKILPHKNLVVTLLILCFLCVVFFSFFQNNKVDTLVSDNNILSSELENLRSQILVSDIKIPEGWKRYVSSEWDFGFAYPNDWVLKENQGSQGLSEVSIDNNDGYEIKFDRKGRGASPDWTYAYNIGGYPARTWKTNLDGGYYLTLGVVDIGIIVYIKTPQKNTELPDRIISTILFLQP